MQFYKLFQQRTIFLKAFNYRYYKLLIAILEFWVWVRKRGRIWGRSQFGKYFQNNSMNNKSAMELKVMKVKSFQINMLYLTVQLKQIRNTRLLHSNELLIYIIYSLTSILVALSCLLDTAGATWCRICSSLRWASTTCSRLWSFLCSLWTSLARLDAVEN